MRQSRYRRASAYGARYITKTSNGCPEDAAMSGWLAGYEAARRDARKPLKVSDIVTVTVGPLTSGGKALDMRGALLCGDHGIEGPTGPRGVSPTRVRDASNPTAFSIVSTDDGTGEVLTIPALGSRPKHAEMWADWGYLDNGHCPFALGHGRAFCSKPYGHDGDHQP